MHSPTTPCPRTPRGRRFSSARRRAGSPAVAAARLAVVLALWLTPVLAAQAAYWEVSRVHMSSSFFDQESESVLMAACAGHTVQAATRHEAVPLARACLPAVFEAEGTTPYVRRIIGGGVVVLGHYQRCTMTANQYPGSTLRLYWCSLRKDDGSTSAGTFGWAVPNVRETEPPEQVDPDKQHTPEPDPCGDAGAPPDTAGNPVVLATGAKEQHEVDVAAAPGNPLLHFTRRYSSRAPGEPTALGTHWRHPYARRLEVVAGSSAPSAVRLVRASGNRYTYTLQADGRWAGDPDVRLQLAQTDSGWRVVETDGTVETYDVAGRLVRLAAPSGATVTLHHAHGRLAEVRDPASGRTLTLTYDAAGRLAGVSGPDGTHHYAFDAESNLAAVTRPDGRTRYYHYADTRHPHALTGITDAAGHRYAT